MTDATARTLFKAGRPGPRHAARSRRETRTSSRYALGAKVKGDMKAAVRKHRAVQRGRHRAGHRSEAEGRSRHLHARTGITWASRAPAATPSTTARSTTHRAPPACWRWRRQRYAQPAKRSQMFLWVAAEEQGLLGSAAYASSPLWPAAKTAANLNLDSLNFVGAARDIGTKGSERTELGAMAAATAKAMGLAVSASRSLTWPAATSAATTSALPRRASRRSRSRGGSDYIKDPEAAKAKRKTVSRALPPGEGRVRSELGPVGHGAAGAVHAEPGPHGGRLRRRCRRGRRATRSARCALLRSNPR